MDVGNKPVIVSMVMDASERKRAEREAQALYDLLREQSIRDVLTGLYNRRYLDAALERELVLARRNGRAVSVVICDIDHFKAVNDGYGHLAGDEVLRTVAGTIVKHCRASDIGCRYGGEEFLLVMPDVSEDRAGELADRLRAALAATPIKYGQKVIAVTASFGVAGFPHTGRDGLELLAAADAAMYAAKRGGRNRVKSMLDLMRSRADLSPHEALPIESRRSRRSVA
jgi:diguanylate cyclase (GGDEF)-like protein